MTLEVTGAPYEGACNTALHLFVRYVEIRVHLLSGLWTVRAPLRSRLKGGKLNPRCNIDTFVELGLLRPVVHKNKAPRAVF